MEKYTSRKYTPYPGRGGWKRMTNRTSNTKYARFSHKPRQISIDIESGQISSNSSFHAHPRNKSNHVVYYANEFLTQRAQLGTMMEAQNQNFQFDSSQYIDNSSKNCDKYLSEVQPRIDNSIDQEIEQNIGYEIDSHDQRYERFSLRIWVRNCVLKQINDIELFRRIKEQTQVAEICYDFEHKIPEMKGATIQLYDQKQSKIQSACLMLAKHLSEIEEMVLFDQYTNIVERSYMLSMLIPRMLIPLVMGKSGNLIQKLLDVSKASIFVCGRELDSNFQHIQVITNSIENTVKCCCAVNSIAFKSLKEQSVNIGAQNEEDVVWCEIGILMEPEMEKVIFEYSKLMTHLERSLNISVQIISVSRNQNIYMLEGQLKNLKIYFAKLFELFQLQACLDLSTKFIISYDEAKLLTRFNGKYLRDISNKCEDCFFRVKDKDPINGKYPLKVVGSPKSKSKAVNMLLQLFAFRQQMRIPIDYQRHILKSYGIFKYQDLKNEEEQSGGRFMSPQISQNCPIGARFPKKNKSYSSSLNIQKNDKYRPFKFKNHHAKNFKNKNNRFEVHQYYPDSSSEQKDRNTY